MSSATDQLQRFVEAQQSSYADALAEVTRGRKTSHWMWFVFPQVSGLGRSSTAQFYAIADLDEAQAYLTHPVLGHRLREISAQVAASLVPTAEALMGGIDALKLRSAMTLFLRAAQASGGDDDERVFDAVLQKYFAGQPDPATDAILGEAARARARRVTS